MENELDPIQELVTGHLDLLNNPKKIIGGMTYDEFCDWLETGNLDDLLAARTVFEEHNLMDHIKVMDMYIKKLQK